MTQVENPKTQLTLVHRHKGIYILGHTFWVQLDYRAVNIYRYPQRSSTSTASSRNRAGSHRNFGNLKAPSHLTRGKKSL